MNLVVLVLAVLMGTLAEGALPGAMCLAGAKAPVVLGIVVYYAMGRPAWLMVAAALGGALMRDSVAGIPAGLSAAGFLLAGAAVLKSRDHIVARSLVTQVMLGWATGFMLALVTYVLLVLAGQAVDDASMLDVLLRIFGSGFLGMVSAPVTFRVMETFDRMMGNIVVKEAHHVEGMGA